MTLLAIMSTIKKFKFKQKCITYTILEDVVYWKGFDGLLLRCSEWVDQQIAMHKYHDGTCGAHFSGYAIAKCLIIMGYYWPIMEWDLDNYVKKYVKC